LKKSIIERKRSGSDLRSLDLQLSKSGKVIFLKLNKASQQQALQLLSALSEKEAAGLIGHMTAIMQILQKQIIDMDKRISLDDVLIRTELYSGDIGYVTHMHGILYKKEYGYEISFEAYVAMGLYEFYKNYNPQLDRVWVAEHQNKIVGFLLLMVREKNIAQLRYFILDPNYRGIGLGKKLAGLYMDYFHEKKFKSSYLLTTDELFAAAHIYKKMGFVLTEETESTSFGKPLKEQRYDLVVK
jgi:peptidyl-dipeptidase Dcp